LPDEASKAKASWLPASVGKPIFAAPPLWLASYYETKAARRSLGDDGVEFD
jgi:hypothetical protein